jgi:ethanolamine utilization protein EutP (predicted NTPase)
VLAWRIATECVEYVTQSNMKADKALERYNMAVGEAGRANAYTIGSEDNTSDDGMYPFLTERY